MVPWKEHSRHHQPGYLVQESLQHVVAHPAVVEYITDQQQHIAAQSWHRINYRFQGFIGCRMTYLVTQMDVRRVDEFYLFFVWQFDSRCVWREQDMGENPVDWECEKSCQLGSLDSVAEYTITP